MTDDEHDDEFPGLESFGLPADGSTDPYWDIESSDMPDWQPDPLTRTPLQTPEFYVQTDTGMRPPTFAEVLQVVAQHVLPPLPPLSMVEHVLVHVRRELAQRLPTIGLDTASPSIDGMPLSAVVTGARARVEPDGSVSFLPTDTADLPLLDTYVMAITFEAMQHLPLLELYAAIVQLGEALRAYPRTHDALLFLACKMQGLQMLALEGPVDTREMPARERLAFLLNCFCNYLVMCDGGARDTALELQQAGEAVQDADPPL